MGRYLLVAHQTADSLELRSRVVELLHEDPAAEFVLLVPATPIGLLQAVGGESRTASEVARARAGRARSLLRRRGRACHGRPDRQRRSIRRRRGGGAWR